MILELYKKVENAGMVEQVDTQDLKSCGSNPVRVRFPFLVQKPRPDSYRDGAFDFLGYKKTGLENKPDPIQRFFIIYLKSP